MEHQYSCFESAPHKNKRTSHDKWTLFIDGASRGNPGKAGIGIYITKNDSPVVQEGFYVGIKTNNQAEYLALVVGIHFLLHSLEHSSTSPENISIISDSLLLIKQVSGAFNVYDKRLKRLKNSALHLLDNLPVSFRHVLRVNNEHADALANKGIDKNTTLPQPIIKLLSTYGITIT